MAKFPSARTARPPQGHLRRGRQRMTLEEGEAAQDAIELAMWKRFHDETMGAALLQAADAPDDKAARGIFDRAATGVSSIKSENPRVQNAYGLFVQGTQAAWGNRFARQAKAIKDQQTHDQGVLNVQAEIEGGNALGAATAYQHLITREPEKRVLYERGIADIEYDIAVSAASRQVRSGDPAQMRQGIAALRGVSRTGLREEQVIALAKLQGIAERQEKELAGQAMVGYLVAANKAAALSPLERHAEIERLKPLIAQYYRYRTPEEARATMNWLNAIDKGEAFKTDPTAELEADRAIRTLNADSTVRETAAVRDRILSLASRLGAKVVTYIEDLNTRLDGIKTKAVEYALDDAVARKQLDPDFVPVMRRNLERWINAQKADVSPTDIIAQGAALAALGPPPKPEAGPFTAGAIARGVGRFMVSDYAARNEITDPKDLAIFMVNDALETFGPNWRQLVPQVEAVIKYNSPLGSWHFQTDAEKAATLSRIRSLETSFWTLDSTVLEGDISEGDAEAADEIAPAGKEITPAMVQAFEKYLDDAEKTLPKPDPAGVVLPAVDKRVVGKAYTIRGKRYEWQLGGWKPLP